ncbi:MAG: hypothetical protein ABIK65_07050 [Candidatus Eisenbacteria bacterium]
MSSFAAPRALADRVGARLEELDRSRFVPRLWEKDPSLWKEDGAHRKVIGNRLGWLSSVRSMEPELEGVRAFAEEARADFRRALLLGMGGSSLCPEVLAKTFGAAEGALDLRILDSTDPAAVSEAAAWAEEEKTLFIVASKSGGTAEVDAFRRFFTERVKDPARFIAITDPGSPLEALATGEGYRRVFLNPPDIGGRFSALSFFGLVPAALLGLDPGRLLDRAAAMTESCGPDRAPAMNPGVHLGVFLAEAALMGRDKMTLLFSDRLAPLGTWVEQLVAESTGKEGKGIVPVDLEPAGEAEEYGSDRLFVCVRIEGEPGREGEARRFEGAGHPVARIELADEYGLGAEFFRWEVATAAACAVLGVNAFDEPNVKESKEETNRLLAAFAERGALGEGTPAAEDGGMALYTDGASDGPAGDVDFLVRTHLARAGEGDYLAFLAYAHGTDEIAALLGGLRAGARKKTGLATSGGFGPRFLHSTGQLFKGGPNGAVVFQITCDDGSDLPIPGLPHTFGVLKNAQALGDLAALRAHGRRALRCHVRGDVAAGLRRLTRVVGAGM